MRPLTYVVLKTFSSLKDDLNVASNLEFFMLFCTSSHISGAENTSEFAFFIELTRLDFKLKDDLMMKFLL